MRPFPLFPLTVVPRKWARFVAQVLASWAILGETIDRCRRPLPPGNGTTSWKGQAALGQVVVHINLDETCVKLCPCVPRGAIAIDGGSAKKEALEQERPEPFAWQTQLRRHRLQTPQSRTKFLYSHTAPARFKNSSLDSTGLSKLVHIFWLGQEQVYR